MTKRTEKMHLSELLEAYLEECERGPVEDTGYTDKGHYRRLNELRQGMDNLVRGFVEVEL